MEPSQAALQGFGSRICLVNLARVLDHSQTFQTKMERFKVDVTDDQTRLRVMGKEIETKAASLKSVKDEELRDQLTLEITNATAVYEREQKKLHRQFVQQQADLYAAEYSRLTDAVATYCRTNGILLVLHLRNEDEKQTTDPKKIRQRLNRQVVYHDPSLDITSTIIAILNGDSLDQ